MGFRIGKRYFCIKQYDITDCGAACLTIVARQYGLKIPITKIREMAGTDKTGTNVLGMVKAATELGFSAKGVKAETHQINPQLPVPAIAHVVKENRILHYVVIHEITRKKIIVADPAEGIVAYTPEKFFTIWSGVLILLVPNDRLAQNVDQKTGLLARFFYLLLPRKRLLFEIFLASILATVAGLVGAFYFKYLIDDILMEGAQNTLGIISIGLLMLNLFKLLLGAFRNHLLLYLSQKIDISLILNFYNHVLNLPLSFFDSRKVGEIISRITDAAKIRNAISGATISVMLDTLMVVMGGIVLFVQSRTLFLITLILIPLYIAIAWLFNRPFQNVYRKVMEQAAEMDSYLVESLSGAATVKAFNGEAEAFFETETRFIKLIKSIFRAGWMQNLHGTLKGVLASSGDIMILWVGAGQVIQGTMSVGQLITFNALLAYFTQPIQNLIGLQSALQEAYVAADRLGEILDLEMEKRNEASKVKPEKLRGAIQFQNVDFRYGTRQLVLKDIQLTIAPGETVALVGESGSGKTTLVKLLLKYYLPENGEIFIDNYNIKDIHLESLRSRVGYVPQDVFLFSGSVRDNITFGLKNVTMEEIVEAATQAQAHEFINQLPLRYDTLIGERGSSLSGGQRQRIAIARAILRNPDILILDEATSSLDNAAEQAIHHTLEHICRGITTIIIAHRLSTIMRCQRIFVMENGQIAECGNHQELLKLGGSYYKLWQGQSAFGGPETVGFGEKIS